MRRVLSFLLLFLISIQISLALDFNIDISPEQKSIFPNETAEFNVKLSHDSRNKEFFDVFSSDMAWDVRMKESLFVDNKQEINSKLLVRPLNRNPGFYGVPIIFRHPSSNVQKKFFVNIELKPDADNKMTYVPALRGTVQLSKQIDPRDPVKLIVNIENLNNKDIDKMDVKVRSNSINLDTQTSIKGREKKILEFDVNLNSRIPPSKDMLKISVFGFDNDRKKDYQFDLAPIEFDIIPYGTVEQSVSVKSQFLKFTKTITLDNTGNVKKRADPKIKKSFFKDLFTSFSITPAVQEGYYIWNAELNVGEKQEIVLTTNYWSLFIFIIIILAALTSYFLFRSPVIIRKTAKILSTREGGISELKIILNIQNRSNKKVHNVNIIDLIPNIAEIVKEFDLGTLEPTKIMLHDSKGTIAKWTLDNLEPGEERLINYKVKNKLSVLDGIDLPPAVIKFMVGSETERSTKSNIFSVKF